MVTQHRIDVSHETLWRNDKKLNDFVAIFSKWNKKINLVSQKDASNEILWQRHIRQSLELINFFPQHISDEPLLLADLGSGGGFPSLIAAIYYQQHFNHDDIEFHLIESDQRKVAFLREAARLTNTKIHLHHCRVEDIKLTQKFDIITARALSELPQLLHYSAPIIKKNGTALFYKGKNYQHELTQALKSWNIIYKVIPLSEQGSFIIHCKEFCHDRK